MNKRMLLLVCSLLLVTGVSAQVYDGCPGGAFVSYEYSFQIYSPFCPLDISSGIAGYNAVADIFQWVIPGIVPDVSGSGGTCEVDWCAFYADSKIPPYLKRPKEPKKGERPKTEPAVYTPAPNASKMRRPGKAT